MKRKLIIIVFLMAVFLRFYNLDKVPPALFSDEADLGYQAYSFLKTGKDYFGNFLPINFHSFADFRTPLYLYATVPSIAVFGLNEWGVRLPAAIFGSLTIFSLYFLILKLSKRFDLALVSALVLAITPWHIHYSRAGFEITSMLAFLTTGFWLFYKDLERKKGFFLSSVVFALTFYTYAPVKLFLPLLLGIIFFIERKAIFNAKKEKIILSLIIFLLIAFPMAKSTLFGQGNFRFGYLNIFSDREVAFEVDRLRLIDASFGKTVVPGMKPPFFSFVFHNKPVSWFFRFIDNYLSAFSPQFIFARGDPNLRHSLPNFGLVLLIFAPFCLWGLAKAVADFKKNIFWLLWFFLSSVASSVTFDGANHVSRLSFLIIPLVYFTAEGIISIFRNFQKLSQRFVFSLIIVFLVICNFTYYLHLYYFHYPLMSEKEWHYGLKQAIEEVIKQEKNYQKVYFTNSFEPSLIFYLFWSKFPPNQFNAYQLQDFEDRGFKGKVLNGKYYFGNFKEIPPGPEKSLLLVGRNDLGRDFLTEKFHKQINSLTGDPRFFVLESD